MSATNTVRQRRLVITTALILLGSVMLSGHPTTYSQQPQPAYYYNISCNQGNTTCATCITTLGNFYCSGSAANAPSNLGVGVCNTPSSGTFCQEQTKVSCGDMFSCTTFKVVGVCGGSDTYCANAILIAN